ncbi:MAG: hypothetical protein ACXQS8_06595 [Candidatus Helarchaeales archaeon]
MTRIKTSKKKLERLLKLIRGKAKSNDASLGSSSLVNKIVLDAHENELTCLTACVYGNVVEFARLSGVEVIEPGKISIPIDETLECLKTLKNDEIEIEFDKSLKISDGKAGWDFTVDAVENIPDLTKRNPWDFLSSPIGTKAEIPSHLQRKAHAEVVLDSSEFLSAIDAGTIAGKRNKTLLIELEGDLEKGKLEVTSGLIGEKIYNSKIQLKEVKLHSGEPKIEKTKFSYGMGNVFSNVSGDVQISFISVRDRSGNFGNNIFVKHEDSDILIVYYISRVPKEAAEVEQA